MALVVFATALLTLTVEVFYTRLFAALFWRNTAFAILSLAMLGIGASGVLVYLRPRWFSAERCHAQLSWLMVAFGASILASYVWILSLSQDSFDAMQPLSAYIALVFAGLMPFFFGGLVLTVAFTHGADRIAHLYRVDLIGASIGAVIALPLVRALNGPLVIVALALGAALVAAAFAHRARRTIARAGALALCIGCVALAAFHETRGVLRVTHSHGQFEHDIEVERWDPLARITVQSAGPESKWLNIDSQVVTAVLRYDGDPASVEYLKHNVLQLAYRLRTYPKVVIVGPGGGSDVLAAVAAGNRDVTGVEVNRSTIGLMRNELAAYTGGIYDRPEVTIRIADGRAYVAAMDEKVDLIQATFVDTFTSSASGGHTISENYLYTVDGFRDFLDHLKPDGVLSMSRWGGEGFGFAETYRAVALALRALEERGVDNPPAHIVVVQGAPPERLIPGGGYQRPGQLAESMSTLLVKTTPFTREELFRLQKAILDSNFRPLWLGGLGGTDSTVVDLVGADDRSVVYSRYREQTGLDISPVTDDRPFFFDMIDPVRSLFEAPRPEWTTNIYYFVRTLDIVMLHQLLFAVSLVALALLVVPLVGRWKDLRGVRRPASLLGYFVCLGVGFIGIELALMQRFSLFLEHPVYSLVVFLASILLFSGFGSAYTATIESDFARRGAKRAGVLVLVLMAYGLAIPLVTRALIGLPLVVKMVVSVALAFPPAFLMGMLFPIGVSIVRERAAQLVPWVWGLNSAFSVVGAVASLFLAMSLGYSLTWFVFVGAYGLAAFSLLRLARV